MPKRKTKCSTTRERSSTDGVLSHERKWSELPEDILHLFSKKLPGISDFIRFRVVCKRWQLSAPVSDPPPQLPWLLVNQEEENGIIRFYCLSSGKVHTVTCPGSCHAWHEGPAFRYLIASHLRNSEMYLLNPLTHDQIRVPLLNVRLLYWKPDYIGPDPIEGSDIVVISGYSCTNNPSKLMAYWCPKANDWVYVEGVGHDSNAYYMGQYFSIDRRNSHTNVIDIATKKMAYQVAPPEATNPPVKGYPLMVESGGKILRLFQYHEDESCHFNIYRLNFDDGEGKPCWVKITDIGDQILFLQNERGLSVCASNFVGFKGNCIYFITNIDINENLVCRYDTEDGTTKVLPCPFDSVETWFVHSLV